MGGPIPNPFQSKPSAPAPTPPVSTPKRGCAAGRLIHSGERAGRPALEPPHRDGGPRCTAPAAAPLVAAAAAARAAHRAMAPPPLPPQDDSQADSGAAAAHGRR